MSGKITVTFTAGSQTKELVSPVLSDERVKADLNAIRLAQKGGDLIELDWLSIHGGNVVAANVRKVGTSSPRVG